MEHGQFVIQSICTFLHLFVGLFRIAYYRLGSVMRRRPEEAWMATVSRLAYYMDFQKGISVKKWQSSLESFLNLHDRNTLL